MKKRLVFIALTVLWMGLIFFMSAQVASDSSNQSMFITERIIRLFISNPSSELLFFAEVLVRKAAHFTEYFILAFFVYGIFDKDARYSFVKTFCICLLYAISDEIHQYFVPGRACRFFDVMVDTAGCLFYVLTNIFFHKVKR